MNRDKILVVEDEKNICNFMKMVFENNGYQIFFAENATSGMTMYYSHHPDLVLLDLGLPDMDGVEVIKKIRTEFDTPIIVLSARSDEKDKVQALDYGANDYVTKPFGTSELLARVRAALRINRFQGIAPKTGNEFQLEDLVLKYDSRQVRIRGEEIRLTQTEYNIVELLSVHAGKVLTYSEIIKKIWGYSDSGSIKKLQVNMANIRKKFGEHPGEYRYILNELGVGYRMREEGETE